MKKLMVAAAIVCAAAVAQAATFNWSASGVKDAKGENLYSGDATITAVLAGGGTVGSWDATMSNGAISYIIDSADLQANKNYMFTYKMTDASGNVFTSGTVMGRGQATSTPLLNFAAGGTWELAPTPEPTSALLLLLGVAGLALKRKQA